MGAVNSSALALPYMGIPHGPSVTTGVGAPNPSVPTKASAYAAYAPTAVADFANYKSPNAGVATTSTTSNTADAIAYLLTAAQGKQWWNKVIVNQRALNTAGPNGANRWPGGGPEDLQNGTDPAAPVTAGQIIMGQAGGTVQDILALQDALWKAGFFGPTAKRSKVVLGTWTANTAAAMLRVFAATLRANDSAQSAQSRFSDSQAALTQKNNPSAGMSSPLVSTPEAGTQGIPWGSMRETAAGVSWQSVLNETANASPNGPAAAVAAVSPAYSTTDSRVNLTNNTQSQGYLQTAMQNLLGRAPTSKEVNLFQSHLNGLEKAAPTVTNTNVAAGGKSQSSTSKGGVDASVAAENSVVSDYSGERQRYGIGSYMDAFTGILGGG